MTYAVTTLKTIVVLGASYGGHRAIQVLLSNLPGGYRLVVLERNTHANHIYAFPRVSVVGGHEHKVFIPYTNIFKSAVNRDQHLLLQAIAVNIDLSKRRIAYRKVNAPADEVEWLDWQYLIYAAGSHLPDPINVWKANRYDGSKRSGIQWLQDAQKRIRACERILVVGGGALGVHIAATYAMHKKVTLTHSRDRLLTRFDPWMHEKAAEALSSLGVHLVLGSRVDLSSVSPDNTALKLEDGRQLDADLILFCLGQKPNTSLLPAETLNKSGLVVVLPTMQLLDHPTVFAIGDAADTFGAINAGHTAWDQAEIAAENMLHLIHADRGNGRRDVEMQSYKPTPPAIKVSLGIQRAIRQTMDGQHLQVDNGVEDLNSGTMWTRRGLSTEDMYM